MIGQVLLPVQKGVGVTELHVHTLYYRCSVATSYKQLPSSTYFHPFVKLAHLRSSSVFTAPGTPARERVTASFVLGLTCHPHQKRKLCGTNNNVHGPSGRW